MNTPTKFFAFLLLAILVSIPCSAQVQVWHQNIQQVNANLRGAPVVLGLRTITVDEPGQVLVQFDGNCVSTDGDRILLAASNTTGWGVNDGHVAVEAYDNDVTRHSFSHSRMYSVGAGSHTFYAVGQNFVETAGSGLASVYASLTVKFFPGSSDAFVSHSGIIEVNRDVRGSVQVIEQSHIWPSVPGDVLVRFEGMCVSDPGDLIVLAASNSPSWSVNDGNTGTEAITDDLNTRVFCHSRRYSIGAGLNTFYAVAQNFVETAGDGRASFYGSLTIEFFPAATSGLFMSHTGVSRTNIDVEGAPVTMGQLTINPTVPGTALVRYEGLCASSPGDRVVMAASNTPDWSSNSGNVNVEAVSTDYNYNNFSHTRAYYVQPGLTTFYGVCENFVETAGNGIASNYASLSVEFFMDPAWSAVRDDSIVPSVVALEANYPNPFNPSTTIAYSITKPSFVSLRVFNLLGQNVRTLVNEAQVPGRWLQEWDGRNTQGEPAPSGIYLYQLTTDEYQETRKMVLMK